MSQAKPKKQTSKGRQATNKRKTRHCQLAKNNLAKRRETLKVEVALRYSHSHRSFRVIQSLLTVN